MDNDPRAAEFEQQPNLYKRKFGAFRPQLKGRVDGYFPNDACNFIVILLMLLPAYIISFVTWWGCVEWGLFDTYGYCYFCFAIFMAYIVIIIWVVHFGSLARKKLERVYIHKKIEEKAWIDSLMATAREAEMQALVRFDHDDGDKGALKESEK